MEEIIRGYLLRAAPVRTSGGRWSVSVFIRKQDDPVESEKKYIAEDGISYILEEEAAKESLNLGRNIIRSGWAGF